MSAASSSSGGVCTAKWIASAASFSRRRPATATGLAPGVFGIVEGLSAPRPRARLPRPARASAQPCPRRARTSRAAATRSRYSGAGRHHPECVQGVLVPSACSTTTLPLGRTAITVPPGSPLGANDGVADLEALGLRRLQAPRQRLDVLHHRRGRGDVPRGLEPGEDVALVLRQRPGPGCQGGAERVPRLVAVHRAVRGICGLDRLGGRDAGLADVADSRRRAPSRVCCSVSCWGTSRAAGPARPRCGPPRRGAPRTPPRACPRASLPIARRRSGRGTHGRAPMPRVEGWRRCRSPRRLPLRASAPRLSWRTPRSALRGRAPLARCLRAA